MRRSFPGRDVIEERFHPRDVADAKRRQERLGYQGYSVKLSKDRAKGLIVLTGERKDPEDK